jgi:acetoin:2,6-dichlorophenolindophenol oxidoreductase subunit alpha
VDQPSLLDLFRTLLTIRRFEERVSQMALAGLIPGSVHVCIGQEAVPTGVCGALQADDYVTSTHRGHGHCIAKGADLDRMMAELLARRTGSCKGKGGSMHISDASVGLLGANGIVGGGIPIAVGAALSAQLRGTAQVAVCFFGDGAGNQGTFHESLNLAAIWKLPVIFVCENNQFTELTYYRDVTSVDDFARRAAGYDIPGVVVDGQDVTTVLEVAREAVRRARRGDGPTLLEAKTYRFHGHMEGERFVLGGNAYRAEQEIERVRAERDPIQVARQHLLRAGLADERALEELDREIVARVERAATFAQNSPETVGEEALEDLYATPLSGSRA